MGSEREENGRTNEWVARPGVARAIRLASLLVPIALALLTGLATSRLFGRPSSVAGAVLRIATTIAVSSVVLAAADRVTRRFVPLAALFHFTLVFPDRAPSRFGIALRSGNSKHLEKRIADARRGVIAADADQTYYETLLELVSALNRHDRLTRGHCERTRAYTDLVIKELALPTYDADRLRWASLLHDIGKLGVDSEILNKSGKPTDEEWEQLRAHPEIGERLAAPIAGFLGPWMSAISQHHERWDGGGYPAGLARTDIHLGGRIVAVTDAYDVMTSARSYRKPISPAAARRELVRCSGSQFDPEIVRVFLSTALGRSHRSLASLGSIVHVRELLAVVGQTSIATTVTGSVTSLATAGGAAALTTALVVGPGMTSVPPPSAPPVIEVLDAAAGTPATAPSSSSARSGGSVSSTPSRSSAEGSGATQPAPVEKRARPDAEANAKQTKKQAEADEDAREDAEKAAKKRAEAEEDAREDAEKAAKKQAEAEEDAREDVEKAAKKQAEADEDAREDAEKAAKKQAEADEDAREDAEKAAAKDAKEQAKAREAQQKRRAEAEKD